MIQSRQENSVLRKHWTLVSNRTYICWTLNTNIYQKAKFTLQRIPWFQGGPHRKHWANTTCTPISCSSTTDYWKDKLEFTCIQKYRFILVQKIYIWFILFYIRWLEVGQRGTFHLDSKSNRQHFPFPQWKLNSMHVHIHLILV